ncbi:GGDEF domain-containing protein [Nannocystis bainbridge]|uniref:diguanylate cyclase n=1 Tax=Nannocystis bainbridge TaxID=2995303 RepID=A0ABT5E5A1_9BACT|nr:GGDEF domain-containing protein [Nannocystis bainbridge]MDC0721042.1 GGDEF domain-containing protein [Nannocystis bainbridge]
MTQARSRISEYQSSEDERSFIRKAYDKSLGDADRLAYAKLVEDRDPARAEWLRLEVALHSQPAADPAVIARFIELGREIGFDYANLLLRDVIMNCGSDSAKRERPRVRFTFACTKRWETLAPTDAESVRFCQQCKEQVYYCDTVAAAESRALAGQCIAIPKQLSDGGVESHAMGRPDPVADWAGRLFSGRRRAQASDCYLVIVGSGDAATAGRLHRLEAASAPITVGRSEQSAIVLGGGSASRNHARFERRTDGWWVVDNGSTNGTYVNAQQRQEAPLHDGDRIRIGDTALTVVDAPPNVEPADPLTQLDGLTRLHNRRYLIDHLEHELQTAKISGQPLSLVLLDVARFKSINDTYGHLAGDRLLREIALRLRPYGRPGAVLARHAGDQFALLLPGTDPAGATALAEQICEEVAGDITTDDGHTLSLTLLVGIAQANEANCTVDRLIAAAAEHLFAAKLESRRPRPSV